MGLTIIEAATLHDGEPDAVWAWESDCLGSRVALGRFETRASAFSPAQDMAEPSSPIMARNVGRIRVPAVNTPQSTRQRRPVNDR